MRFYLFSRTQRFFHPFRPFGTPSWRHQGSALPRRDGECGRTVMVSRQGSPAEREIQSAAMQHARDRSLKSRNFVQPLREKVRE